MTEEKYVKQAWKQLVTACTDDVARIEVGSIDETVTSGPMFIGHQNGLQVWVRVYVYKNGIHILRRFFPMFRGRIQISWQSIQSVEEFRTVKIKLMLDHTDARLSLKTDGVPLLIIPWRHSFRKFLPDSAGYTDSRSGASF